MKSKWKALAFGVLLAFLSACAIQVDRLDPLIQLEPLPTSHSFFVEESGESSIEPGSVLFQGAPTVSGLFRMRLGHTPSPTLTRRPTLTPLPQPSRTPEPTLTAYPSPTLPPPTRGSADLLTEVFIYDDELNTDWLVYEPSTMAVDLQADGLAYTGRYAIEAVPQAASGTLLFAVRPYPEEHYPREKVLALSFMIYNAEGFLGIPDLTVAVLGSNSFYSYVNNDVSVHPDGARVFSLTPLEDLEEGAGTPANTWVEVIIWLDDLVQDPEYRFVTGFCLENLAGTGKPFRIDEVKLILAGH